MECYAQTISVSLSLKLKPVNAKVDVHFFYRERYVDYTLRPWGGGGGSLKGSLVRDVPLRASKPDPFSRHSNRLSRYPV